MLQLISRNIGLNIRRNVIIRLSTPSKVIQNQCSLLQCVSSLSTSSNLLAKKRKKFKNQQKRPELVEVDDDEDDNDVDDDIDEKTALAAKGILHKGRISCSI